MTVNLFQFSQSDGKFTPRVSGETFPAPEKSTFDLVPSGKIGSVIFWWNGVKQTTENRSPWRVGGDAGVLKFVDGDNTLTAHVYEKPNGKGQVLLKSTWVFKCPKIQPPGGIVQKLAVKGVCCYGSDDASVAGPILADQSVTAVRWWFSTMFRGDVGDGIANDAREWKAEGVKRIVVTCTPPINTPFDISVTDIRLWAKSVREKWAGLVDAVQIINECNLKKYYPGTIEGAGYVAELVADELDGSGIEVFAPSISRDVNALKTLVGSCVGKIAGYSFHSYGKDAKEHIDGVIAAAKVCGNAKLICTEFGLHAGSFSGWRTEIEKSWQGIKPYVSEAYCYRLIANQQPAGRFGMMADKAMTTKNDETYQTWQGLAV